LHPNRARVEIFHQQQQEGEIASIFDHPAAAETSDAFKSQTISLLLYPETSGETFTSEPLSKFASAQKNISLFVIDSTWPQSKRMNQKIPSHIKRVHIDNLVEGPSMFLIRKQNSGGGQVGTRVSTLEATALALRALGESEENVVSPLFEALRLSVDACLHQTGKKKAYGNVMRPLLTDSYLDPNYNGPFRRPQVNRPSHCFHCKLESHEARLKNRGTKPATETTPLQRCWYCKSCKNFFYTESL